MITREKNQKKKVQRVIICIISMVVVLELLVACGPSAEELEAVDYTPLPGGDWAISTPEE